MTTGNSSMHILNSQQNYKSCHSDILPDYDSATRILPTGLYRPTCQCLLRSKLHVCISLPCNQCFHRQNCSCDADPFQVCTIVFDDMFITPDRPLICQSAIVLMPKSNSFWSVEKSFVLSFIYLGLYYVGPGRTFWS